MLFYTFWYNNSFDLTKSYVIFNLKFDAVKFLFNYDNYTRLIRDISLRNKSVNCLSVTIT